ncbi:MAG: glutathione S-transferase [Myxococcota bacterium]|nr:glutathione S-transferase [Myxococcota bacterium]
MLTLYHAPRSRSSRFIWLLEELGADYEIEYVEVERMGGIGSADPRNPHPDKKVPALVHDGALITESAAICLYLTDLHPEAGVGPGIGDPLRGPYLTWLAYNAGVIEPVAVIEFAKLGDNEALSRTFRGLPEMQQRIVSALSAHPYLLGDAFSGADVLIGSMMQWGRHLLPAGDPVDAYVARLEARPALARALAKDEPPAS